MSIIRFFISKEYRVKYTRDFSDKLEKEQVQIEAIYKNSL